MAYSFLLVSTFLVFVFQHATRCARGGGGGIDQSPPQIGHLDVSMRVNEFSFHLYKEIVHVTKGNILFSPFSIFIAFTMLGIGANGTTKAEISSALKWGNLETLVRRLKPLYEELSRQSKFGGSRLDIANKIWISDHTKVLKPYRRKLASYFHSRIGKKSFSSNPELARRSINEWIEERTNKNIKNMFPESSFDSMTQLVLGNAIFFKGKWASSFDRRETQKGKFYLPGGKYVVANYMSTEDEFPAYFDEARSVQLLEVPYADGIYSMIFVMPQVVEIREIEHTITPLMLSEWVRKLTAKHNTWSSKTVFLPKFKIEQSLPLARLLQKLSIKDLFHPWKADLSGINGEKTLFCSSAVHKSYIEVDEEGTVASSATGVGITMLSYPITVRLERPFLFYIIHKPSNTIVFSGKITNPVDSGSPLLEDNTRLNNEPSRNDNSSSALSFNVKEKTPATTPMTMTTVTTVFWLKISLPAIFISLCILFSVLLTRHFW